MTCICNKRRAVAVEEITCIGSIKSPVCASSALLAGVEEITCICIRNRYQDDVSQVCPVRLKPVSRR